MEVVFSAVLGDVISRFISFFMDRCSQLQNRGTAESLQRLRRVLLRVQATIEEAERRHISNHAMLQQLDTLRHGMYRGYYVLDAFTCRGHGDRDTTTKDEVSNKPFALSRFNPAKRLHLSPKNMVFDGQGLNELRKELDGLEMIVADMAEFVVFLKSYPPVSRQPCSSYLFSDMYMFGRHTEYERIVNFLLQIAPPSTGNCGVLPIVGPVRVGKTTLVEHACYDERVRSYFSSRVRSYFSSIVSFSRDDLEGAKANTLQDSGVVKYRNGASHGRLLIILELTGNLENEIWRRLCSSLSHIAHGSKVIVTSRSERIVRFGTTQALQLNDLPQEAYWYYFKMIALRNAGPMDCPELSSIAREIAAGLRGSFTNANIIGTLLRGNPDVRFWRKVLEGRREFIAKHILMFGEHPVDLVRKDRPIYLWRMTGSSEVLIAHRYYEVCSPQQDVPKLTVHDVVRGRAMPHGKFEYLAWKSQIPPYSSYLVSCSIMTSRCTMVKNKKRSRLQTI